jgi:hypothetical protein
VRHGKGVVHGLSGENSPKRGCPRQGGNGGFGRRCSNGGGGFDGRPWRRRGPEAPGMEEEVRRMTNWT